MKRPEWFTIEDLAEEWGCSVQRVKLYIRTKQIYLSSLFTHPEFQPEWLDGPFRFNKDDLATMGWNGYEYKGDFIRLTVVERFENDPDQKSAGGQEENQPADNPELFSPGGDQEEIPGRATAGGEPSKINKGGRPPGLLRQVVEAEYPNLEQGQTHKIDADYFGKHLACLLGEEGNKNRGIAKRASFAHERIKSVTGKGAMLKVVTQERHEQQSNGNTTIVKSKPYTRKGLQDVIQAVSRKIQAREQKKVS